MEIRYTVRRSARQTAVIEITRTAEVLVRAPMHMSDAAIRRFVEDNSARIESAAAKRRAWCGSHPEPSPTEREALRDAAKEYLPQRVEYYASIMGVCPASVRITAARTRYGSCSAKNGVCFSLYLMQYPPEAIDYVVVHELAHILHKNHSAAFYACIAAVLPDYKARSALLR